MGKTEDKIMLQLHLIFVLLQSAVQQEPLNW